MGRPAGCGDATRLGQAYLASAKSLRSRSPQPRLSGLRPDSSGLGRVDQVSGSQVGLGQGSPRVGLVHTGTLAPQARGQICPMSI